MVAIGRRMKGVEKFIGRSSSFLKKRTKKLLLPATSIVAGGRVPRN
jgi:hypothetical protein